MPEFRDLTGQTFSRLTVLERAENGTQGRTRWLCVCECGTRALVLSKALLNGNTKSCGCLSREMSGQRNFKDLTGCTFGRWTVVARGENTAAGRTTWLCRCECGAERAVFGGNLSNGSSLSCGCFNRERIQELAPDLTGQTFGRLTAIAVVGATRGRARRWRCLCVCGKENTVSTGNLRSGNIRSCGCLKVDAQVHDLAGKTYGRLTVLERVVSASPGARWRCLCACGKEHEVSGKGLVSGDTQSCGCLNRDIKRTRAAQRRAEKLLLAKYPEMQDDMEES